MIAGRHSLIYHVREDYSILKGSRHPRTLTLGQAMLTVSGMQLSRLAPVEPVAGFVEYVAEFWKRYGVTLTPLKAA
jgi:hypothetical protein